MIQLPQEVSNARNSPGCRVPLNMSDIQIDKAYKRVNDALEKFSVGSLLIGFYQGSSKAVIIGLTF